MFGLEKNLRLHFIGVGGIGMSGIAEVLLNLNYKVSGSDLNGSPVIESLKDKGLKFFQGHHKSNIKDVDIVIYSSAVKSNNPEYIEAEKNNIPIIKRAEMLAELMRLKFGIAIAGSHGKTTTTSILATILNGLKLSPTYIVGGVVKNLGSNAGLGEGDILVAEADESDGSFHFLNPIITVLTNIDNDHLDHYGSLDALIDSFINFTNKIPFYGKLVLNIDDETIFENLDKFNRRYISFSSKKLDADYFIENIEMDSSGAYFDLKYEKDVLRFNLALSGLHNVYNCVGAIIVAHKLGHSFQKIQDALKKFEGVGRRLEIIAEKDKSLFIDDYAHHPTEIEKTIDAIKKSYSDHKIKIIFEPHRYTRTQNFWDDFIATLSSGLETYILPIFPAGEEEVAYIDSEIIVKQINENGTEAHYLDSIDTLKIDDTKNKTVYLFMGAGPISKNARKVVSGL